MLPRSDRQGQYIVLTSHGRTATNWVANALNSHPDFFCTHAGFKIVDGPEAERGQFPKEIEHIAPRLSELALDEYFALHRQIRPSLHYASIHNFQLTSLVPRCAKDPPENDFVVVNLIRHPVSRARSIAERNQYAVEVLGFEHRRQQLNRTMQNRKLEEFTTWLSTHHDIDLSDLHTITFLCSLWTIMVECDELRMRFPHIPMERLVCDPEYLSWFIWKISCGQSVANSSWIDTVYSSGRLNTVGEGRASLRYGRDVFERSAPWRKAAWRRIDDLFGLVALYDPHGYDLSFLHS